MKGGGKRDALFVLDAVLTLAVASRRVAATVANLVMDESSSSKFSDRAFALAGRARLSVDPSSSMSKCDFSSGAPRFTRDAALLSKAGCVDDGQNVNRTPSWITRNELARTPLIEPNAGFVC